jgi:Skp family chaperone for outer membrane proteins
MRLLPAYIVFILLFSGIVAFGQSKDSTATSVTEVPVKYLTQVSAKADKYSNRITSKTEKTLTKLSKWEQKIHTLLQKADPATAERLFGAGKPTFTSMLQKLREGKAVADGYKAQYDSYTDKLTTGIKYLETKKDSLDNKFIKPIGDAKQKMQQLDKDVAESEAVQKMIKERRKELADAALKTLGKSKYLSKINKEAYYYTETLRNYKELFNDPKKAEETALTILNKIPAFGKFMRENGALASLFGSPSGSNAPSLAGLQTRANVNSLIQDRIAAGGPNARAAVAQNMQAAQAELQQLKDKVLKAGGGSSNAEMPDFKPNTQKTKTFKQRLERGMNFQIGKSGTGRSAIADMGLSLGYKLNDKSIIGVGASYKMGYGSIQKIRITHEGVGLRSFVDWKLPSPKGGAGGGFFISGGYELNHVSSFTSIRDLQATNLWQQSGLIGISKKLKVKTKLFKETKFQLMYDMLCRQHIPVTQPFVFRVGYNF